MRKKPTDTVGICVWGRVLKVYIHLNSPPKTKAPFNKDALFLSIDYKKDILRFCDRI